jgi:hypothetical protein
MKQCTKCNLEKSLDSFYTNKTSKDGLRSCCKTCDISKAKKWNKKNLKTRRIAQKKWRELNRQKSRDHVKRYRDSDKGRATRSVWLESRPDYNRIKAAEFRAKNPGYQSHYVKLRRATIKTATPKWLTNKQKENIKLFYIESSRLTKETGIQHHVDHIHPLTMKDSNGNHIGCGLHVPWNLQVITADENFEKGCQL